MAEFYQLLETNRSALFVIWIWSCMKHLPVVPTTSPV